MGDTVTPFAIGLLEFSMIDLMGPDTLGPWFVCLASVFGISIAATHVAHRRARKDPANDYFFSKVAPANWRNYLGSFMVVLSLLLIGAALWLTGNRTWMPLAALLYATAALAFQLLMQRRYWMHSLVQENQVTENTASSSSPG